MHAAKIEAGIREIETALGDYLCTHDRPCAAAAYYDEADAKPWRIADDHASERFATLEEAVRAAESWAEEMAG